MSGSTSTSIVVACLAGLMNRRRDAGAGIALHRAWSDRLYGPVCGRQTRLHRQPVRAARVLETEARTEGWSSPTRLFMRLPCFNTFFFWPLANCRNLVASALWETLSVFGVIASPCCGLPAGGGTPRLACCWSLPVLMTVAEGQDIGWLNVVDSDFRRPGSPESSREWLALWLRFVLPNFSCSS